MFGLGGFCTVRCLAIWIERGCGGSACWVWERDRLLWSCIWGGEGKGGGEYTLHLIEGETYLSILRRPVRIIYFARAFMCFVFIIMSLSAMLVAPIARMRVSL
jgi:hypothetical protein